MSGILFFVAAALCIATLAVLMFGIGGFGSGKMSPRVSNKLMQMRILFQFLAVIALLLMGWAAKEGL